MNIRRGLFRLWIVVSAAWVPGSGIIWYQNFAPEQAQIATLDECEKVWTAIIFDEMAIGRDERPRKPRLDEPEIDLFKLGQFEDRGIPHPLI
jgi:hypothetical protein